MFTVLIQSPRGVLRIDKVKGSVSRRQNSTCLVLPPIEGFVFFSVHGNIFPPTHPHPGPWAECCVSRSCPVVSSLFLTIHWSSWIPAQRLSVHLPAWCTREASMEISVIGAQSKEKWALVLSLPSRAPHPEHGPSPSLQVYLEFQMRTGQSLFLFDSLFLQAPHCFACTHLQSIHA